MRYTSPILILIILAVLFTNSAQASSEVDIEIFSTSIVNCQNNPCILFFEIALDNRDDQKSPSKVEDYFEVNLNEETNTRVYFSISKSPSLLEFVLVEHLRGSDQDIGRFTLSTSKNIEMESFSTTNNNAEVILSLEISEISKGPLSFPRYFQISFFSITVIIIFLRNKFDK